jgi:hypothetical protein
MMPPGMAALIGRVLIGRVLIGRVLIDLGLPRQIFQGR